MSFKHKPDMSSPADSNADIIQEFLAETRENMDLMERDLVAWEKQPGDREMLDRIFRAIHTLKGTCGFLAFAKLEGIAHQSENLLSHIRDGRREPGSKVVTVLLQVLDAVRRHLSQIERTGEEASDIFGSVLADLQELQEASPQAATRPVTELEEETTGTGADGSTMSVKEAVFFLGGLHSRSLQVW